MNPSFICPNCKSPLLPEGNSYRCKNGHSFDRAKSGYVNLLLPDQKRAKIPGDNKEMVLARQSFLEKGYYAPLAQALSREIADTLAEAGISAPVFLDAGCGEGYYTKNVAGALKAGGLSPSIFAVDISKFAADRCARHFTKEDPSVLTAAASVFRLPIADGALDGMSLLFAPYCGSEFRRVLKPGGFLFMVIPDAGHLWEFKSALYEKPYPNEVKDFALEGFSFLRSTPVETLLRLDCQEDIQNLFAMTPYAYKSGADTAKRLKALDTLETKASFLLLTYQKD